MAMMAEILISVEEDRLSGKKGYSIDDTDGLIKSAIWKVSADTDNSV